MQFHTSVEREGFYRIRIVESGGYEQYSSIVEVKIRSANLLSVGSMELEI